MVNLRSVQVDVEKATAWVESGATIGELYYGIAQKSRTLAFPAGLFYTVGVGGQFSGGGYGPLFRKYGLAADNVIDARLIDAKGRILDRKSMGEDFVKSSEADKKMTIKANFSSMFLGSIDELVPLMEERFPEFGLVRDDCLEMSWVEAILSTQGGVQLETLLERHQKTGVSQTFFKAKFDCVKQPIPEMGLEGLWPMFYEEEAKMANIFLVAYGGKMDEIPETEIPFPHRAGIIYSIIYVVDWDENGNKNSKRFLNWIRRVYDYMTPYVSNSPREAYVNYKDLQIGSNNMFSCKGSYAQAKIWGRKYFKNNFDRLVYVKTKVDPENFFRHEQSIPPLSCF
ncbi:hypothetical protein Gorai_010609 [Gossypium raimondii]|uniref:FAD-binding PCMH-type domain-containing protein n=1 Tax=Gossypium raimondii TaxID=29730 RepID=A0A7J8PWL3_GOSRA|nr:hypothetical protein [Gossypium raimondii]